MSGSLTWVRAAQAERVQDKVHRLIHIQALRVDPAFYDNPDSYDLLYRATVDALSQPMVMLQSLGALVQNGLGFLLLAGILWKYAGWLPFLLVVTGLSGSAARCPSHFEQASLVIGAYASQTGWLIRHQPTLSFWLRLLSMSAD